MDYAKKVIVLKQINKDFCANEKNTSAIARIEVENGVGDFFLSVINVKTVFDGSYFAFVCDGNHNLYSFDLGKRPITYASHLPDTFNYAFDFCVGLCFVKDYIPTLFCFAKTDDCSLDVTFLKKKIAEHLLTLYKSQPCVIKHEVVKAEKPLQKEQPIIESEQTDNDKTECDLTKNAFDDEAVATENYFSTEEQIDVKLDKIEEFSRERLSHENDFVNYPSRTKKSQSEKGACSFQNETNFSDGEKHEEQPYYLTVKEELEKIFTTFEQEDTLSALFTNGKWAKINFSRDRYYVVGLILEDNKEKYICYGVPDNYSDIPPKEFDGYCCFLPCNPDKPKEKGYWMIFQDAFSGRCVSRNINFTPNKDN